jgi:Mn-dependent DtxR family transcriptional regulator
MMKRKLVDQKVQELAEHFLAEIPGVKPEDITELAEEIQERCEDCCRAIEAALKDKP